MKTADVPSHIWRALALAFAAALARPGGTAFSLTLAFALAPSAHVGRR